MSQPLGFNNTYALGMKEDLAERLGITKISDLRKHPQLKLGFANEFMNRQDGWPGLRQAYRLPQKDVRGLEHELAYVGLQSGAIQVTDLYSTDAEIAYYHLRTLKDDLHFFPTYDAVLLYRSDLVGRWPKGVRAMLGLEGKISESDMIGMNEQAKINKIPASIVAAVFPPERIRRPGPGQEGIKGPKFHLKDPGASFAGGNLPGSGNRSFHPPGHFSGSILSDKVKSYWARWALSRPCLPWPCLFL